METLLLAGACWGLSCIYVVEDTFTPEKPCDARAEEILLEMPDKFVAAVGNDVKGKIDVFATCMSNPFLPLLSETRRI